MNSDNSSILEAPKCGSTCSHYVALCEEKTICRKFQQERATFVEVLKKLNKDIVAEENKSSNLQLETAEEKNSDKDDSACSHYISLCREKAKCTKLHQERASFVKMLKKLNKDIERLMDENRLLSLQLQASKEKNPDTGATCSHQGILGKEIAKYLQERVTLLEMLKKVKKDNERVVEENKSLNFRFQALKEKVPFSSNESRPTKYRKVIANVREGLTVKEEEIPHKYKKVTADIREGLNVKEEEISHKYKKVTADIREGLNVKEEEISHKYKKVTADIREGLNVKEEEIPHKYKKVTADIREGLNVKEEEISHKYKKVTADIREGLNVKEEEIPHTYLNRKIGDKISGVNKDVSDGKLNNRGKGNKMGKRTCE